MGFVYHCDKCKAEIRPYADQLDRPQPCRQCLEAEVKRLRRYPEAIAEIRSKYPLDVFPDTHGAARMARLTCDNIERLQAELAGNTTDTPHDAANEGGGGTAT